MKKIILTTVLLIGVLFHSKAQDNIDLVVGTYGDHLYIYDFNCQTLEFTLKAKTEARNASYALEHMGYIYAVSETGSTSGMYSFKAQEGTALQKTADRRYQHLQGAGERQAGKNRICLSLDVQVTCFHRIR